MQMSLSININEARRLFYISDLINVYLLSFAIFTTMPVVNGKECGAWIAGQGKYMHMRIFHFDAPSLHTRTTYAIVAVPTASRLFLCYRLAERLSHFLSCYQPINAPFNALQTTFECYKQHLNKSELSKFKA
jgi:hypothetical protein